MEAAPEVSEVKVDVPVNLEVNKVSAANKVSANKVSVSKEDLEDALPPTWPAFWEFVLLVVKKLVKSSMPKPKVSSDFNKIRTITNISNFEELKSCYLNYIL